MTPIDHLERKAALDMDTSVIVQAPAGSGKTEILCQRFLLALARVEQPEQVLAITFTRKAANEMRERIVRYLNSSEPSIAESFCTHPERLSIMTIDGLCARILEQTPITSGLYGYRIADAPFELYRLAANALLEDADEKYPWQQALHMLLIQCDNNWQKLHQLLMSMLAQREQWLMLLPEINEPTRWRQHLEENLKQCLQEAMNVLQKIIPAAFKNRLLSLLHFAARNSAEFSAWQDIHTWPGACVEDEILWRTLTNFLLTKENQFRKTVDKRSGFPTGEGADKDYFKEKKQAMLSVLAEAQEAPGLLEALQLMNQVPSSGYTEREWERVVVILTVLRALLAYWHITIQKTHQVDFTEISLRALNALGNDEVPSELALTLDYRLQHILVDEFQDTSLLQFRLLERLTQSWQDHDGHTLFLVGDPLQSIYRFRQAEVGLFLRTWQQGFANLRLNAIQLKQNFRAQKNLVEFYNDQLAKILPKASVMHEGAIAYVPVVSTKEALTPSVVFVNTASKESSGVKDLIDHLNLLRSESPEASIAILVRSRRQLYEILPALQQAHLEYQARDLTRLADQPVVIDLLSWLKALLQLDDRLSWLSMLHAPCLQLSQCTLQKLFEKDTRIVWQRLLAWQQSENLDCTEQNRLLQHAIQLWQVALNQVQRKPVDQILFYLWQELQANNYWCDQHAQQAMKQFFLLLQQTQTGMDLEDVAAFERRLSSIPFSLKEQNSNLEIMTVHKAKGLEFDIVLLPHLEHSGQHDETPLLVFDEVILSAGSKFLLAPFRERSVAKNAIFDFLWQLKKNKAHHERLRLLYVACTRAKQAIYLYAQLSELKEEEIQKPRQGSFLADLWPLWRGQ